MNSKSMILILAIRAIFFGSGLFAAVGAGQNTVLYDNGNLSTGNRAESGELVCCGLTAWSELQHDAGNSTEANMALGFDGNQGTGRLADDFIIPSGNTWTINSVTFFTYAFDSPIPPVYRASLRIWNGRPGDMGSTVVFGDLNPIRLTGCEFTHMSRISNTVVPPPGVPTNSGFFGLIWKCTLAVSPALTLGPGTYWVDWDSQYGSGDGFEFPHGDTATAVRGLRGYPDWNARRYDVAAGQWSDVFDPGDPASAPDVPQDFPFKINGTLIAPGGLDPSFDGDGKVTTSLTGSDIGYAVGVQSNGKIVVAGTTINGPTIDFCAVRYNTDGTLDTSFDGDGKVVTDISGSDEASAVAIQPDGKIIIAGYSQVPQPSDFSLVRYNADGSMDTSFGVGGKVTTDFGQNDYAYSVLIQPDGKIVASGLTADGISVFRAALARYNIDGSLDTSFGNGGKVMAIEGNAYEVALQPDGKIVTTGWGCLGSCSPTTYDLTVVRYTTNGSTDAAFGMQGKVTVDFGDYEEGQAIVVQADGKILAVGGTDGFGGAAPFLLVRLNYDGTLDSSFDGDGKVTTSVNGVGFAQTIAIQQNSKIIVGGSAGSGSDFAVARYHSDGSLDVSFGGAGIVTTAFAGAILGGALQSDDKFVAAGYTTNGSDRNIAVARYTVDTAALTSPIFDYDGDGRTDISVFRPSNATWYLQRSSSGFFGAQFGISTDKIVPADYDRDGETDIAVYRPSEGIWYMINSSNSTFSYRRYGLADDLPTPADYDGDGRDDLSVFRPSNGTWYRQNSFDGTSNAIQFGTNGDKPTLGDFDGDGKADVAVFRPSNGTWYRLNSANGAFVGQQFGISTDLIVPADYDGDGKTDIGVYRASEGNWYLDRSTLGFTAVNFGAAADIATPGDFDGDGRADISVFRPTDGNWYRLNSSDGGFSAIHFGMHGDRPTPGAFSY